MNAVVLNVWFHMVLGLRWMALQRRYWPTTEKNVLHWGAALRRQRDAQAVGFIALSFPVMRTGAGGA